MESLILLVSAMLVYFGSAFIRPRRKNYTEEQREFLYQRAKGWRTLLPLIAALPVLFLRERLLEPVYAFCSLVFVLGSLWDEYRLIGEPLLSEFRRGLRRKFWLRSFALSLLLLGLAVRWQG